MQTPLMHNSDVGIVICHATINFKQIYCGNSIEWRAIWFETTKIWFQTILHDTKFSCITFVLKSHNLISLIRTFGQYWYFIYSVAKRKKRKRMRKRNLSFCFVLVFQLRFREKPAHIVNKPHLRNHRLQVPPQNECEKYREKKPRVALTLWSAVVSQHT